MVVNQNIEIFIDKLILNGFAANRRQQIADAVQAELTRLFSVKGIPDSLYSSGQLPVIKAKSINVGNNAKGKAIGNKIAGSVYKSFKK
jgi:hypothetical protein